MLTVKTAERWKWVRVNDNYIIRNDGVWHIVYNQCADDFSVCAGSRSFHLSLDETESLFTDLNIVFKHAVPKRAKKGRKK